MHGSPGTGCLVSGEVEGGKERGGRLTNSSPVFVADIQWWLVVAGGAPSLESVRVSVPAARDWARGSGGHTRVTIASTCTCTDNR